MEYLFLLFPVITLGTAIWAAPRIKKELDELGLKNTLIDILSWRPRWR